MPRASKKQAKEVKQRAAEAPESLPEPVPPPPDGAGQWLEDQVRLGLIPKDVLDEYRHRFGLGPSALPAERGAPVYDPSRGGTAAASDKRASTKDWEMVFQAYAESGDPDIICKITGLDRALVRHLLENGIRRLGLKPIREAATDYAEAETRAYALVKQHRDEPQHLLHLANAREAATQRAAKENAAAQGMLISSLQSADAFLGLVNAVLERTVDPEGGFDIPKTIDASYLNKLADTAQKLAAAVDKGVRLSRFVAGEPERSVQLEVAALVCNMSPAELESFRRTGEIPIHLRSAATGSFLDAEFQELDDEESSDRPAAPPAVPPPPPPPKGT